MRLFISINFDDTLKNEIISAQDQLRRYASRGNFSLSDNLHLTLVFIGETNRIKDVKEIIDGIDIAPFRIDLGRPGVFRRDGGDIYWIGVTAEPGLYQLADFLQTRLREAGFDIERRPYKPHITIGRQVECGTSPHITVAPASMTAKRVSLMKSERMNGRLTYTEIHAKELKQI
ncbi:MAG: RNA 2',3'-cyclic phosphodiesterase [Clostridia bacterium]|nr:RNA 2',3'-cyclic phosphodiesterase [Clostridia bacterium]